MTSTPVCLLTSRAAAPGRVTTPLTWSEAIDGPLLCVGVQPETHDVMTFTLRFPEPMSFRFNPGQYVTLTVEVDGQQLSRCYTIASPPGRPDSICITVKRVPGGPVSNWLHDQLRPGTTVLVSGPNGQFSTTRHPAAKYLFLSAGSGITPLISMLRASADSGQNDDIVFVHSARAPRDVIFAAELAALEASQANIRVITICEQVPPGTHLAGQRGRLSLPMLQALVPDLTEREVFTCGPVPYMEVVRQILKSAAVDPTRCHEESFDLSHSWASGVSADRRSPGDEDVPAHCIELRFSARRISCPPGTTVLAAAAAAGLSLRSSCAEGVCGTCKTTLISGEVEMNHQGGIRSREIDQHKILLCCSTPTTDLVIDA